MLRITNEDEGKSEVVTWLSRSAPRYYRFCLCHLTQTCSNSSLEGWWNAARFFKKARDFCKFFPFFLPFLRGGYSSYFGIFLFFISRHFFAEIAVYRIPAPRGQTVSCYFDYKVSVVLKKFSWKGFFMIRLLIVVVVIVVCCFKGTILFL